MLNVIHVPSALRLAEYGLVKSRFTLKSLGESDLETFERNLEKGREYWGFVETPLFIYDYEQRDVKP